MAPALKLVSPAPTKAARPAIEVAHLTKAFYDSEGDRVTLAVSDVSFCVAPGEFVCIVGPSGCGKTTVLRILADLEQTLSGTIRLHSKTPPAMVFQEASVLPWLTVSENIAFPLSLKCVSRAEQDKRVADLLALTGLTDFARARPHQLSGGMKQRVSVARALVDDRDILLMDEPFGALDVITRERMGFALQTLWEESRNTVLFVTHSITEAVLLSDIVVVMSPRPGRIHDIVEIDLPRSRTTATLRDPRFVAFAARVREGIEAGETEY